MKQAELAVAMFKKNLPQKNYNKKLPPKNSVGIDNKLADYISHKL